MSDIGIINGKETEETPLTEAERNTIIIKFILTDIRDYLVTEKRRVANSDIYLLQIQAVEKFTDKALADLTEYAEKLGVEL